MRKPVSIFASLLLSASISPAGAQTINFELFDYGPFDYTNPEHVREHLPVVEKYHFNAGVENLTKSIDNNAVGSHLLYVIRSFPNHHRALRSFTRLWALEGTPTKPPSGVARDQTPDFVYQRAIRFAPMDGMVKILYGIYLLDSGHKHDAIDMFDKAAELSPQDADINYNLGLMYLKVGQLEKASVHAEQAYDQGYPLPGLRRKLVAAGVWKK